MKREGKLSASRPTLLLVSFDVIVLKKVIEKLAISTSWCKGFI